MTPEEDRDRPDDAGEEPAQEESRTFLCVVDDTEELHQALRFACRRAQRTGGRVALLYVIEPAEFQHWMAIGNLMADERREEAEEMIQVVSSVVQKLSGSMPVIYIREGKLTDQLMELIENEKGISVLVLGAATGTGNEGPGRLLSYVMKRIGKLPIPITIVPGGLSDKEIDGISE